MTLNKELWLVVIPALCWFLGALGGTQISDTIKGQKWLRRFLMPAILGLAVCMRRQREKMTKTQQVENEIAKIVRKARQKGFMLYKNNINKAKPVDRICGVIKSKYPYSTEDLFCR